MSVKDCKTEPYAPPIARGISGGKWVPISPRREPIKTPPYGKGSPAMKRDYAALLGDIKKGAGTGVQIPR